MMRPEDEGSSSHGSARAFSNGAGPVSLLKTVPSTTNGTHKSSQAPNGATHTNGDVTASLQSSTWFGHDREEITRILIQALGDLGYSAAATTLSNESGYELESPAVAAFRNAVLQGEWSDAEELLFGPSRPADEGGVSIHGVGLALAEGTDKNMIRFWMRRQKFLELLEQRDTGRALMVLRTELTPLYQNTDALHFLSSLLMCQSVEDIKAKANWDGAHGGSRHQLLSELSKCISPSVMLPETRLAVLLQQVKQSQISNCLYHNTASSPSLLYDHMCDRKNFPLMPVVDLDKYNDEVWQVQFSHDGKRLASCGSARSAIIYDTETFEVVQTLLDHEDGVCSLAWSPDDTMIVTCSQDKRARLWDATTGDCLRTLRAFEQPVSSCVWAPDGQSFITGCLDKEQNLCQWGLNGSLIYDWKQSHRIQDLAISADGQYLVAMDNEEHLWVYNLITRELLYSLNLKVKLSSISISQDSRCMLVNQADGQARLFDIETQEPVRAFAGHKSGNYVIRSDFGGANEAFVTSGSEDGSIFIWHKENGGLVEKLEGHRGSCCNSVSWNPQNPSMFASGGDDCKVRVWSNQVPPRLAAKSSSHSNGSHRTSAW